MSKLDTVVTCNTEDEFCALMPLVESQGKVIKVKNGISLRSLQEWRELLKGTLGLVEDKRHFDHQSKLTQSDWWEISYQADKATSYAYSNTRQPLHTDNAWFADPAELNFFCMRKQAQHGGEQTVIPLDRLIDHMTTDAPELLHDLCSTPVTIQKGVGEYKHDTTIIKQDNGLPRVFWNYYRTDKSQKQVEQLCEAFFNYLEALEATSLVERMHCNSGDCFVFNDTLMLHGREAFTVQENKDRVLLQSMWKYA